jgi:hypothetical protein
MRARIALGVLFATCAAATSALAQGQGTITDPPATYVIPAAHYDTSPAVNFTGVGPTVATDHLFENGWWYRIAGDASEKFFPVPTSPNFPAGTTYTVSWTNVDGRGFDTTEVGTVINGGGPSGNVTLALTIINPSAGPVTFDLFNMADIDLAGTAGTDSATLLTPNELIGLTDGVQTAQYRGIGANAFLVRPFGATDVATVLSDGALTNFDNSGLPFGPGDFTAGFQWTGVVVPAGESRTVTAVMAINTVAVPVELMNFRIE